MGRIIYNYDGHNFEDMNVVVKASAGIMDLPTAKDRNKFDWGNMNGSIIDQEQKPQYQERKIELQCQLYATSAADYVSKMQNFEAIFQHAGLRMLSITLPGLNKPLIYLCYLTGGIQATKTWSEKSMVGSFTLTLEEPEPLKKVMRSTAKSVSLAASMNVGEVINIYWGDGSKTLDVTPSQDGDTLTASHTYSDNDQHIIVITGDIDSVTLTTQTATTLWNLL